MRSKTGRWGLTFVVWFATSCGGSEATVANDDASGSSSSSGSSGASSSSGSSGTSGSSGSTGTATGGDLDHFSFFVTSYKVLQELSGTSKGFGGDLRFGETGAGAGLRGADKICATIAEKSMAGAGSKSWRAFLSAKADENGAQVDAIDRIGEGPWYDRLGRVFALKKADLLSDRPSSADATIKNDFPNEDGIPNHAPDGKDVDNHDMLTGSDTSGKLYSASATCLDWTSAQGNTGTEGKPRVGHSWPRGGGGGGGPGGGGSGDNWMSSLTESGCAPGVNLVETGGPRANEVTVGSGGGYGGFYCFSLTP